jgi:hypothetical protein
VAIGILTRVADEAALQASKAVKRKVSVCKVSVSPDL